MSTSHVDNSIPASLKPFLRGHFHQAAFFFGLGACAMLITTAPTRISQIAASIYTLCLALLFGMSSLYHRISWSDKMKLQMRKLDHVGIFIFIAGTATPICLIGISGEAGNRLLWIFWIAAAIGILKEYLWNKAPRWTSAVFYVAMGWLAFPYLGEFQRALGPTYTWLLIAGGIIYTLGALVYAFRWPDPYPRVFGFHEIFHALVVVAVFLHFLVIYSVIMA